MFFTELNLITLIVLITHLRLCLPADVEPNCPISGGNFNKHPATIEVGGDFCPYSFYSFNHSDVVGLADVGFKAQIQVEISYWMSEDDDAFEMGICSNGDIIIDYEETQGVQVKVNHLKKKAVDQIYHKKIIDIQIKMSDLALESIQNHHKSNQASSSTPFFIPNEDFSITISPTYYNKYCEEEGFPRKSTLNLTFGCDPNSSLLLKTDRILKDQNADIEVETDRIKIEREKVVPFAVSDRKKDITINGNLLYYPREKVGGRQRKFFGCTSDNNAFCKVPISSKIKKENIYSIKTKYEIFPIFEQIFSKSSPREVYGNVILYDILGAGTFDTNTTMKDAGCLTDGDNWYEKSIKYHVESININTDIYKYYIDCFNSSNPNQTENQERLEDQSYFIFNQTNNNSIQFPTDKNNIIILKAVAVNTNYSRFTFCHRMEGYFVFRVIGVNKLSRVKVHWTIYLIIFICALGILCISYIVFSLTFDYRSIDVDAQDERKRKRIKSMDRKSSSKAI